MKILFAGGGSVGHIAPSVAVWQAMKQLDASTEPLFLCSDRMEDLNYIAKERVPVRAVALPKRNLWMPMLLVQAYRQAALSIRLFKPDVVFSKGGAVSVPICLAAWWKKIPIVLHESDARMGIANRMIAKIADTVCLGFDETMIVDPRMQVTGNPVRAGVTKGVKEEGLRITGFSGDRPVLMVIGGSQGATAINDVVRTLLPKLLETFDVIHLTGPGKNGAPKTAGYFAKEFAYEELPHLYAVTSVALSRAGAGGICELAANGIQTILTPLRGVANDHQQANALAAARSEGCIVLPQEKLSAELLPTLQNMIEPGRHVLLSERISGLNPPNAAQRLDETIRSTAKK